LVAREVEGWVVLVVVVVVGLTGSLQWSLLRRSRVVVVVVVVEKGLK